ncbi:MAG: Ig-like domain-containing protein [Bacteroidaceae bacterium]|nr:Ig-like domain-containing protein [Bacteroidaceae bacterium]
MKHFTFSLKMLLFSLFVVGGVNSAWADNKYTIGWGTASGENSKNFEVTNGTIEGILSFNSAQNASTTKPAYNSSSKELRLYYNSNGDGDGGSITLTPATGITITGFVMTTSTEPSVNYSVDGGTATSVTASSNIYTVTGISATESLTIQNVNKSNVQLRIKTIEITYITDSRAAVNMTGFSATNTTLVKGNTTVTTVTNDQAGWTAAYTYSSSKESVATVDGNGVITAVAKGTATITATLNVDANDENYRVGETTSKTLEITVNNPNHTASFSVNGTVTSSEVEEGEDIAFPTETPADVYGKSFVGWASSAIVGTTNVAPTFVTSATMGTSDVIYYAVFAASAIEVGNVTDELTNATTGVGEETTYSNWSGKTASSSAVYAGNSAGNYTTIQLRSNNSNSGVVSTTSGGKVTKVVVEWNSNSANGRTLDVYGNNTAYEAATDLYNTSKQGTKLGSIVNGTSTELVITGDYAYIGVRSNSGALYLDKLSITWVGTTTVYSDYCTTVPTVTISSALYATYVTPAAVSFGDDVTAYVVSAVGTDNVTLTEVESVPANTPVVVKADAAGTYPLTFAESATAPATNYLLVSDVNVTSDGTNFFALANMGGVGFYVVGSGVEIPAGKCYINTSSPAKSRLTFNFEGEDATAITAIEAADAINNGVIYNLSGQRVVKPLKGIYIQNGKKILVK